jgi:hypothetical protein
MWGQRFLRSTRNFDKVLYLHCSVWAKLLLDWTFSMAAIFTLCAEDLTFELPRPHTQTHYATRAVGLLRPLFSSLFTAI